MRILLVGNYLPKQQCSMQYFAAVLKKELQDAGNQVRLVRPLPVLGRWKSSTSGIGKWMGYGDCFALFRPKLQAESQWADVVHICDHANAVYIPWLNGKPHVVTCHDLLAIRSARGEIPENPVGWTGRIYQHWIFNNLHRAQRLICVSQQTLNEWLLLGGKTNNSCVVANALHYPYRPIPRKEILMRLRTMNINEIPYVLHVGSNAWYKNRDGLLRLFAALVQHSSFSRFHLVLAGKPLPPDLRGWVHGQKLTHRVTETGPVSNDDLRALYCGAQMLLFPSLQEGFGWPIIEAQACGCPVVTTNRPPMTEVGGQGAIYIDPARPRESTIAIAKTWPNRHALIQAGFSNVQRYSLSAMLEGYLTAYAAVTATQFGSGVSRCNTLER